MAKEKTNNLLGTKIKVFACGALCVVGLGLMKGTTAFGNDGSFSPGKLKGKEAGGLVLTLGSVITAFGRNAGLWGDNEKNAEPFKKEGGR